MQLRGVTQIIIQTRKFLRKKRRSDSQFGSYLLPSPTITLNSCVIRDRFVDDGGNFFSHGGAREKHQITKSIICIVHAILNKLIVQLSHINIKNL